jgi:hypothetical protein
MTTDASLLETRSAELPVTGNPDPTDDDADEPIPPLAPLYSEAV